MFKSFFFSWLLCASIFLRDRLIGLSLDLNFNGGCDTKKSKSSTPNEFANLCFDCHRKKKDILKYQGMKKCFIIQSIQIPQIKSNQIQSIHPNLQLIFRLCSCKDTDGRSHAIHLFLLQVLTSQTKELCKCPGTQQIAGYVRGGLWHLGSVFRLPL